MEAGALGHLAIVFPAATGLIDERLTNYALIVLARLDADTLLRRHNRVLKI